MKITPDDPKLTAYALGELDKSERAAIEAELEKSFVLQRAVEEIRETAAMLGKKLAAEELPELAIAQQRKIENQLKQSAERPRTNWWRILFYGGLTAATCLIVAMLLPATSSSKRKALQVALNSQPGFTAKQQPFVQKIEAPTDVEANSNPVAPQVQPAPVIGSPALSLDSLKKPASEKSDSLNFYNGQPIERPPVQTTSETTVAAANSENFALSPPANVPASGAVTVNLGIPSQSSSRALALNDYSRAPSGIVAGGGRAGGGGGGGNGVNHKASFAFDSSGYISENEKDSSSAEVPALGDIPQDRFYRSPDNRQTSTATYPHLTENSFLTALNHPLSTFSIDVDTASYANVRRFLNSGQLPPQDAVRIEEMVNYFHYNYPQPRGEDPFSANIEIAGCPWNSEHRLVRIGLKGREIAQDKRPPSNFVFLIDVSGSMQPQERLPLIKEALRELVKKMTENDRVAIVIYAGAAGVKLGSTPCSQKEKILEAIDELGAGGSTAGAAGIQAAYEVAQENFIEGGVNRVLLCTDGDFNVGITDQSQLVQIIQDKAKSGVFLTTLGVGTDNYKDALMQKLADKGNGNYFYLDSLEEAQKVLIDQMSGTLVTIAKDVKIQVEFNPAQVGAYRLIGYEKRMLRKEDFNNDKKDAGEIGAGHTVTALYEIVPPGEEIRRGDVDPLKYQQPAEEKPERYVTTGSHELLTLKLRYKQPDGDTSKLLEFPVTDSGRSFSRASTDFKFATAVAEFGMLLRDSEFKGDSSYGAVLELARQSKGNDAEGYRSEFINLVNKAQELQQ